MTRAPSMPVAPRSIAALALLPLLAVLHGPARPNPEEPPRPALEDARRASTELVTGVRSELLKAVEASGPLRALVVCKYTVPEIASNVSRKYGARVTRVSLTSTGAKASAPPGTYDILPRAAVGNGLTNYALTYVSGTLTVTPPTAGTQTLPSP